MIYIVSYRIVWFERQVLSFMLQCVCSRCSQLLATHMSGGLTQSGSYFGGVKVLLHGGLREFNAEVLCAKFLSMTTGCTFGSLTFKSDSVTGPRTRQR